MLKITPRTVVALSGALIAVNVACGVRMHAIAHRRMAVKSDYGQVNSFKFGLLSVEAWKRAIQGIVGNKIADFQFSQEQEKVLTYEISKVLDALITQASVITQRPQRTLSGSIRKSLTKSFIGVARKNLPGFSQTVMEEIKKPGNFKKLKGLAQEQFDAYAARTYGDAADLEALDGLLARYGAKNADEFNAAAELEMRSLEARSRGYLAVMLGSLALFVLAWRGVRKRPDLHGALFGSSVAFAFVLLLSGLSIPMIELDARINSVDLELMGERVHFNDQVLYYRSKSLTQMVAILTRTGEADSIAVGVLLLLFSVLFPAAKLISTEIYLLGGENVRKNGLVRFFAFTSGKWSMADVTVLAIFMSFIGFKGIVDDQLRGLNIATDSLESIATNASSLQPGFLLFTAFVLYGLVLSEMLKRITAEGMSRRRGEPLFPNSAPLPEAVPGSRRAGDRLQRELQSIS